MQFVDLSQPSAHESTASQSSMIVMPRALARATGIDVTALLGVSVTSAAERVLTRFLLHLIDSASKFDTQNVPNTAMVRPGAETINGTFQGASGSPAK